MAVRTGDAQLKSLLDLRREKGPEDAVERSSVAYIAKFSAFGQDFERFEAAVRHLLDGCISHGVLSGCGDAGGGGACGSDGRAASGPSPHRWYSGILVFYSSGYLLHYLEGPDELVKAFLDLQAGEPWMTERLRQAKVVAANSIAQPLCSRYSVANAEVEAGPHIVGGGGGGGNGGISGAAGTSGEHRDLAVDAMAQIAASMASLAVESGRLAEMDGALSSLHSYFRDLPPPEVLGMAMEAPQVPTLPEYLHLFADVSGMDMLAPLPAMLSADCLAL